MDHTLNLGALINIGGITATLCVIVASSVWGVSRIATNLARVEAAIRHLEQRIADLTMSHKETSREVDELKDRIIKVESSLVSEQK
ncbi:MAG: hypothetical protein D6746_14755 [Bacteroidetes bacterium]|nr:MAG: hypothetical protein D6746_14755 [Bacteroidota bacterium]